MGYLVGYRRDIARRSNNHTGHPRIGPRLDIRVNHQCVMTDSHGLNNLRNAWVV
jgi:hypothetical protein